KILAAACSRSVIIARVVTGPAAEFTRFPTTRIAKALYPAEKPGPNIARMRLPPVHNTSATTNDGQTAHATMVRANNSNLVLSPRLHACDRIGPPLALTAARTRLPSPAVLAAAEYSPASPGGLNRPSVRRSARAKTTEHPVTIR